MKIKILIIPFFLAVIYFFVNAYSAFAAPRYPVKELDNCTSQKECRYYCEIPKNTPACWSYNKYILNANVLGEATTISEENAPVKNIVFPIKELENCKSVAGCREYCQNSENQKTCQEYAVKKNLIKKVVLKSKITTRILSAAKTALGCTTKDACFNFCKDAKNREKCLQFAINQKLTENKELKPQKVISTEILIQAKTELGCTDSTSCFALCEKGDSKEKCLKFSKKFKLMSKVKTTITPKASPQPQTNLAPPGVCADEKECAQYCVSHPDKCLGYDREIKEQADAKKEQTEKEVVMYLGPGGCETEDECELYCKDHPDECPGFPETKTSKAATFAEMENETEAEIENEEE